MVAAVNAESYGRDLPSELGHLFVTPPEPGVLHISLALLGRAKSEYEFHWSVTVRFQANCAFLHVHTALVQGINTI